MEPVVQAAGTALVQAIATDAWQQVRKVVTGLWRRAHPGRADQVSGDLDELRAQVLQARADGDALVEHALEGAWQLRLQELLKADPALAEDLRRRWRRTCGRSWTGCSPRPRGPGPPGAS